MVDTYTAHFIEKISVADDTFQYNFCRPNNFDFTAGQYVILEVENSAFSDDRPSFRSLTIASAPHEKMLSFVMRHSDSGFKKSLQALESGNPIVIKGPLGDMHLPDSLDVPVVFLVAGVGITPARSMLRDAVYRDSTRTFRMIYSNREVCTAACFGEMCDIDLENYKVINVMSEECENWDGPVQLVDADFIKEHTTDLENPLFYVVGTKGYIGAMKAALQSLDVPEDRMIFDNFG